MANIMIGVAKAIQNRLRPQGVGYLSVMKPKKRIRKNIRDSHGQHYCGCQGHWNSHISSIKLGNKNDDWEKCHRDRHVCQAIVKKRFSLQRQKGLLLYLIRKNVMPLTCGLLESFFNDPCLVFRNIFLLFFFFIKYSSPLNCKFIASRYALWSKNQGFSLNKKYLQCC